MSENSWDKMIALADDVEDDDDHENLYKNILHDSITK